MKLLINREVTESLPLIRFKPEPRNGVLVDYLYGFNIDITSKVEFQPVYKPLIIVSKTTRHVRIELFRRIYLRKKWPIIFVEKI